MGNIVVFDLETVPDLSCWYDYKAAAAELEPVDPEAPKPKRGRGRPAKAKAAFAPIWAHRIVTIGFAILDDKRFVQSFGSAAVTSEADEVALLRNFSMLLQSADTLVTWNGRGFDLPVLHLRAFRHGVPISWYDKAGERYRGTQIDLCDRMSDFGVRGTTGYNLDTFSKLIGLPGKGEMDGSMVAEMYQAGKLENIGDYCRRDVVQTTYVYLRYALLRKQISLPEYQAACAQLRAVWSADRAFADFKIDAARLELP